MYVAVDPNPQGDIGTFPATTAEEMASYVINRFGPAFVVYAGFLAAISGIAAEVGVNQRVGQQVDQPQDD